MQTEMLIGGAFTAGENSPETVLNPRTGAAIAEVPEASEAQVGAAVAGGRGAFEGWSRTTPAERSAALLRIADRIEAEADGFAGARGPELRQADQRDEGRRDPRDRRLLALLRRRRALPARGDRRASTSPATPR